MQSKNSSNQSFVERQAWQFVPYLMNAAVKKGPLRAEAIFARKRFTLKKFEKLSLSRLLSDSDS